MEGPGDVELAAADTALCVGDGVGASVEVAALPHPAASASASTISAMYLIRPPLVMQRNDRTVWAGGHARVRLGDVMVTLMITVLRKW